MSISRRSFFGRATAATITAGLLLNGQVSLAAPGDKGESPLFSVPPESGTHPLAYLGRDNFAAKVGTSFLFQSENGESANLTLVSAEDTRPAKTVKKEGGRVESFVLVFSGLRTARLNTGSFFVSHAELGSFDLFLSGKWSTRKEVRYEAVISRLVG